MSSFVTVGGEQNIRRDWDPSVRPEMRDGDSEAQRKGRQMCLREIRRV